MTDHPSQLDITQLVAEHHTNLYRYAYRLAGSSADAEDLTQQTFLQAQANIGQVRDPNSVKSWLFTILRNCYQMECRQKNRTNVEEWGENIESLPSQETAEAEIDSEQLQQGLNELPLEFKSVLLLYYFEELSYREIADALQLPVGTVMSRLSRAKNHLRSKIFAASDEAEPLYESSVSEDSQ